EAGMNVARLNFSHGDYEEHKRRIETIRQAEKETGKKIGILLDTKGPEIRTHKMKNGKIYLQKNQELMITGEEVEGTEEKISVTYKDLAKDVQLGDKILLDDGLIELEVIDILGTDIKTKVLNHGELSDRKGVNVPNVSLNLPGMTEK